MEIKAEGKIYICNESANKILYALRKKGYKHLSLIMNNDNDFFRSNGQIEGLQITLLIRLPYSSNDNAKVEAKISITNT